MKNFKDTIFIFDVDSTLVRAETLDDVIEIAINSGDALGRDVIMENVREITNLGMDGEINFQESLTRRFEAVQILQEHLDFYNDKILPKHIDLNFKEIIKLIQQSGGSVFVVSGGFMDSVGIVARELGIAAEATFANEFIKNKDVIVGFDKNNKLSGSNGKVEITKDIKIKHPNKKVICVGDGNSDYLIKSNGVADEFWGFWENVQRKSLIEKASRNFYSSDALLKFITKQAVY